MKLFKILSIFIVSLLFCFTASSAFASTGAIFTTDGGCTGVNINIFTGKDTVYLDGGPHHATATGLPDGEYYVQVTVPNGTVLGTSVGTSNPTPVHVASGNFAQCYQLSDIVYSASSLFLAKGFDTTTNGGGEYKVWVSQDPNFSGGTNKTDNFKVKEAPQEEVGSISGVKWLDANANGVQDPEETLLPDWTINLEDNQGNPVASTTTDSLGFYEFNNVPQGNYDVCEVIPDNTWHPSYPTTSTPNCNHVVINPHFSDVNVNFGNYQDASLTVIKHVNNGNGGDKNASDFTMSVDGTNVSDGSFPGNEEGTTVTLTPGSYSVDEGNHDGYTKTMDGDCEGTATSGATLTCTITNDDIAPTIKLTKVVEHNHGGTAGPDEFGISVGGHEVLSGSTTDVDANTPIAIDETEKIGYQFVSLTGEGCPDALGGTVTLQPGENIECTITNEDIAPQLTVIKHVINDNGGSASASAFTIAVDGDNVSNASFSGEETPGTTVTLDAGDYTVDEGDHDGYDKSLSTDCSGSISVGQTKTCTITNDDIAPTLTVIKEVNNTHGGNDVPSDFNLHVTSGGVDVGDSPASGSASGKKYTLSAGNYNVSEDLTPGYMIQERTGNCDEFGDVSLSIGENKTCTITNTDLAPTLTLIKNVINNNGGGAGANDFGLTVGGASVSSGFTTQVDANHAYALNEAGLPGYQFVSITGDAKCPSALNGTVTLDEGEDITCTINNDDLPGHLIVIKHVINDDFGTATASSFTMTINGVSASGGNSFPGSESGTNKTLTSVGAYNVTESGPGGYDATFSSDCTGTIGLNQTKTCTITNNDKQGRMTGGGSVLTGAGDSILGVSTNNFRVTHGFEIHCRIPGQKDNIEINWNDKTGKSHKFHLDKLTSAICTKDGNPAPPKNTANGFNVFTGVGTGSYDGVPGATLNFVFTDLGEPGSKDTASYKVTNAASTVVLNVSTKKLDQGNHQAHAF